MKDTPQDGEAGAREAARAGYRIGRHGFPTRPLDPALYLVATPIGNLSDITVRALETLSGADVVACEDTRVTRILLERYAIAVRPHVYHEHNAETAGPRLLEALARGKSVALVSDAGTPLVSDPGYRLVGEAIAAGHRVVPIPGASAPLAALAASGLPTDSFFFAGFLPHKQKARRDRLAELARVPGTLIFFESPRRLATSLADCAAVLGAARRGAVCREMTKAFEEVRRDTLGSLAAAYGQGATVKGEVVLLVEPFAPEPTDANEAEALLGRLAQTMKPGEAATEAARLTGLPRKELYRKLLALKGQ